MNSYERVMGRLAGKDVDYLPNMGLVMFLGAKEAGVTFGDYITNYHYLAEGALRCHEKYGIDMVCAISDPLRETAGFEAEVVIREEGTPYCSKHRIQDLSDINTLKVKDPMKSWRMHDRIEAVRLLKERVGNDIPVVGWIEGALAECCDLMNMQNVLACLIKSLKR
jgi:uroporphyrinogen-III decarboxylase